MKNLIKLIKSDNYLLLISLGAIISFVGIVVMLCILFPNACQIISIILGVSVIAGALVVGVVFWLMSLLEYKVEEQINDDRIFYHE
ncbi:hypothetical protein [Flavobacterium sp. 102]|uniref:hypothetical protein n=1 Tax=Flavobacterium sp. 102 TaxID=2135623 RepID=UPI000EAB7A3A|nr:hypothetical protein [Flavobacterium sp. 102]RKS00461.1 hypothetical protein C8C84_0071 [Flavobacterium sp. 102]